MSRFTFKNIDSRQSTVKKYTAHKSWTITDETAPDYGVVVYSGSYGDASFDSLRHIYYHNPKDSHTSGDNEFLHSQYRNITEQVEAWSIPASIFGDKIKPGSVKLQGASKTYIDDGVGNLYCTTEGNGNNVHWPPSPRDTLLHVNFDSNVQYSIGDTVNDNGHIIAQANDHATRLHTQNTKIYHSRRTGGRALSFAGTSSFATESNSIMSVIAGYSRDTWDRDFAIHTWVNIPPAQLVNESFIGQFDTAGKRKLEDITYNVIATSRVDENTVPWEIGVTNTNHSQGAGRIVAFRGKDSDIATITTTSNWNFSKPVHIIFQKTGSNLELYIGSGSNSAGTMVGLNTTASMLTHVDLINEEHVTSNEITLGGYKNGVMERQTRIVSKLTERVIRPFSGSVDEFVIYNRALAPSQINSLYKYSTSNVVGNIFYKNGFVVLADLRNGSEADDYTLTFKGSQDVETHKYRCTIEDGEFNTTLNATARQMYSLTNPYPRGFVTSSEFTPYITTLGLYNDSNELLAIGKLAQPIKSPKDFDISIDVQFDI